MNELFIYDEIGSFGVGSKDVLDFLKSEKDKPVSVYINSPGGDVFQGLAIHEALSRHKGEVTVYVDGLAASIASIIALAGDKIVMAKPAFFMIHNPFSFAVGDDREMEKESKVLKKVKQSLVNVYKDNSSLSENEIVDMMDNETWLSSDEALKYGFVDEISQSQSKIAACWSFDKKPFFNIPEKLIKNSIEHSSIIFDNNLFDEDQAKTWAEDHGYLITNVFSGDNGIEIQQIEHEDTSDFEVKTYTIGRGVQALAYKRKEQIMINEIDHKNALEQATIKAFEDGKKQGIKEEADRFEDKLNALREAENKRIAEIKDYAFDGQDDLVNQLISDKIGIDESIKALVKNHKENLSKAKEEPETSAEDVKEILNSMEEVAPEASEPLEADAKSVYNTYLSIKDTKERNAYYRANKDTIKKINSERK